MPRIRGKKALITGITGQDGYYLTRLLIKKGYKVYGIARNPLKIDTSLATDIEEIFQIDFLEPEGLIDVITNVAPDEIYHLAAHHFSSHTDQNRTSALPPFIRVNLIVVDQILQAICSKFPETRFFYPASAHIFGNPDIYPQDELTPHKPDTPYAISKSAGVYLCRYFRNTHKVFASVGILYNHESPRRGPSFITTQIARAAAVASLGRPLPLQVRDLNAVVDWGAAKDYVNAMWLMLQHDSANEFIIATGKPHSIDDFVQAAFNEVGLNANDFVMSDPNYERISRVPYIGDSQRLKQTCGWEPKTSFSRIVHEMVTEHVVRETRTKTQK